MNYHLLQSSWAVQLFLRRNSERLFVISPNWYWIIVQSYIGIPIYIFFFKLYTLFIKGIHFCFKIHLNKLKGKMEIRLKVEEEKKEQRGGMHRWPPQWLMRSRDSGYYGAAWPPRRTFNWGICLLLLQKPITAETRLLITRLEHGRDRTTICANIRLRN